MKGTLNMMGLIGIITTIICAAVLQSLPLVQPAVADKDCSWGKTLKESYETPRKGNELGKDASFAARNSPDSGGNSEVSDFNRGCHEDEDTED
jgi:hypothetical protein